MATLTITRAPQFINRFRSYRIIIDGLEMDRLKHAESKTITLSPGTHAVLAKIDRAGSETYTVTLGEQENTTLEVGCNRPLTGYDIALNLVGFAILFGSIGLYETITPLAWGLLFALWILRDVVLTKGKSFLYYLTRGRSRYLYIKPLTPGVSQ